MLKYSKPLLDSIEREKKGIDYVYSVNDKCILNELLHKINGLMGTDFHYLAELDAFNIKGSGSIIVQYIMLFSSESVRAYLIPKLVADKIKDCDRLILQMYLHFKQSDEYISGAGFPAPAHIYTRYDNAISTIKPKRLKDDLINLAHNPRDAFYLPFTMRMLASWKIPELKDILLMYASEDNVSAQDVGLNEDDNNHFPSLAFIKRELRFTAIEGLRHYPSYEVIECIKCCSTDTDADIRAAAKKTLHSLTKNQ